MAFVYVNACSVSNIKDSCFRKTFSFRNFIPGLFSYMRTQGIETFIHRETRFRISSFCVSSVVSALVGWYCVCRNTESNTCCEILKNTRKNPILRTQRLLQKFWWEIWEHQTYTHELVQNNYSFLEIKRILGKSSYRATESSNKP